MSPRELLVLIAMCAVWGFHFVVMKQTTALMPPLAYASVRMIFVAAVLSPFLRWHHGQMGKVFAAGLCFGALNYAFMFSGIRLTSATSAALAIEAYVPLATLLAVLFLGDSVGLRRGAGIAIALAGVATLVLAGGDDGTISSLGVLLVLCAACFEAVGAIFLKRTHNVQPFQLLAWFGVVGAFILTPLTLVLERDAFAAFGDERMPLLVACILYSVFGASIIGHASYYWLLQRLPVSVVAPSGLLTTLLAVLFSVTILGEAITPPLLAGGSLVILGVGIILWRNRRLNKSTGIADPTGAVADTAEINEPA